MSALLEVIKQTLRSDGLSVYDFAEKVGTCKAPYVVVYDGGVEVTPGTKGMYGAHAYEVVCLTPYGDVAGLHSLEAQVRGAMRAMPQLRLSSSGGTGVEQTYQARAVSLVYVNTERMY